MLWISFPRKTSILNPVVLIRKRLQRKSWYHINTLLFSLYPILSHDPLQQKLTLFRILLYSLLWSFGIHKFEDIQELNDHYT